MAERWMYVNEGPVDLHSVANVMGEDWEDVWEDLIVGLEGAPVNEGRTGYLVKWKEGPLLGFLEAQMWEIRQQRLLED